MFKLLFSSMSNVAMSAGQAVQRASAATTRSLSSPYVFLSQGAATTGDSEVRPQPAGIRQASLEIAPTSLVMRPVPHCGVIDRQQESSAGQEIKNRYDSVISLPSSQLLRW
jgi:hypothetical protein